MMKRKYRILKNPQTNRYRAEYREWWAPIWMPCYVLSSGFAQIDSIEEYPTAQDAVRAVERHERDRWEVVSEI